ncbi:hypothetical protein SprV_0200727100 [Sparganum proliferum]
MDDERLPKGLFYGDVATGSPRQGGQVRRYKNTIKTSLKRLQINPANWEDLVPDRPMWRRTVKIGAAILEANRITAAKAKHETRKSQLPPPPHNANANHPQRAHDVDGHSTRQFDLLDTSGPTAAPGPHQWSSLRLPLPCLPRRQLRLTARTLQPPLSSFSSSTTASTSAAVVSAMPINTTHNHDTPTNTNTTTINTSDEDRVYIFPHCDRTFTSHIGLVGHLRIHRTETGEPVPGAPTYTRRIRLHCPRCSRTFMNCMGLLGHRRLHENLQ